MFVDRPRGQAERGIKRERTLRTTTDLVYKDRRHGRGRKERKGKGKNDKRVDSGRIECGEGDGGKDAHV